MARIRIDDLPVAEELTPEQEALLLGAGLKSFRPTLESLEAREVPTVTSALGADGVLTVTGDAYTNKVTVRQEMGTLSTGEQGLVVRVTDTYFVSGQWSMPRSQTFDADKVQGIEFKGGGTDLSAPFGGPDTFTNRTGIDYYVSNDVVDKTFEGLGQDRQLTGSQNLTRDTDMVIRVPTRDGGEWTFRPDAQGRYVPDPGTKAILTKIQGVGYKLVEPNGSVTTYDREGNFTGAETGFFLNSRDLTNGRLPESSASGATVVGGRTIGQNIPPKLTWESPPAGTRSFALIMEDRSAARTDETGAQFKGKYTHWVVYNIPAGTRELRVVNGSLRAIDGAGNPISGWAQAIEYSGPNPRDGQKHNYVFTLYALNTENVTLPAGATQQQLVTAMHGHIIGQTSLRGTFTMPTA
jgi:Raf kinase inhibitor-like YbhB/YbcL family protein